MSGGVKINNEFVEAIVTTFGTKLCSWGEGLPPYKKTAIFEALMILCCFMFMLYFKVHDYRFLSNETVVSKSELKM